MNPNACKKHIDKELGNIWCDNTLKSGDKIDVYQYDDETQLAFVDFVYMIAEDYKLNVNEMLTRYFPDIETAKKTTYTYIRSDKSHGDRWAVLLTAEGDERHISLGDAYCCFYTVAF